MNNISKRMLRKAVILNKDYFSPIGTIATMKFLDAKPAGIGDIFMFDGSCYKILGVVVPVSSELLRNKSLEGIYDCRIVKVENTDILINIHDEKEAKNAAKEIQ